MPDVDETKMRKRETAPYWWPDSQVLMQFFLAVAIVWIVWYIINQLLSGEALKIDPSVRDLIVFIFGIVFGNFKDVYSFTFGSSAESKNKGAVIQRSLDTKDKIIADSALTTAATVTALAATPSTDALKAAAAVAPAAAAEAAPIAAAAAAPPAAADAAPPAAEAAAPAAAREAVKELLGDQPVKPSDK